jgi:hypothetical protein
MHQTLLGWALLCLCVTAAIYFDRRRVEPSELIEGRYVTVKERGKPRYKAVVVRVKLDTVIVRRICEACDQEHAVFASEVLTKDTKPV